MSHADFLKLTPEQTKHYHDEGFLVIPNFASEEERNALQYEMKRLVNEWNMDESKSIFSTENDQRRTKEDHYFLTSGDKIRFFLEEEALDANHQLKQEKFLSVNKAGHALAELNDVFKKFTKRAVFQQITKELGMKDPRIVQSMFIFKPPRIGGSVVPHQDSTFIYTEPMSCMALWVALDNCHEDNSCLWVIPKSHKLGLKDNRRFKLKDSKAYFDPPYPKDGAWSLWDINQFIPLKANKGTLVLMHGSTVHMSKKNTSECQRNAYSVHVIDGSCKYPEDNWLQRPQMPFTSFVDI